MPPCERAASQVAQPQRGDIAWWLSAPAGVGATSRGHLAVVESVAHNNSWVVVTELTSRGTFRSVRYAGTSYPRAFLRFKRTDGGPRGLVLDGGSGSDLYQLIGTTLVPIGGKAYPITVTGGFDLDSGLVFGDAFIISGAPPLNLDSLLAAQVLSLLRGRLPQPVSLTDLFRFPTVRALSAHLGGGSTAASTLAGSTDRARARQEALKQRRAPAGTRR